MLARGPLLLGALLGLLAGTSANPVPNPAQLRVEGIMGRSVSLSARIPPEKAVAQIEWDFQPESGPALVIAEFTKGNWERPNPGDRFWQRLEKADETTLRIRDLEKEDGGVYMAHVRFESAEMEEQKFLLQVSDESEPSEMWKLLLIGSFIVLMVYFLVWLWTQWTQCKRFGF